MFHESHSYKWDVIGFGIKQT